MKWKDLHFISLVKEEMSVLIVGKFQTSNPALLSLPFFFLFYSAFTFFKVSCIFISFTYVLHFSIVTVIGIVTWGVLKKAPCIVKNTFS